MRRRRKAAREKPLSELEFDAGDQRDPINP
jgi:hypothetical protein